MAVKSDKMNKEHQKFIEAQKMFFIGSAGASGFVNVSPKGMDSFKIIDENSIVWLNYTGSGNETSAHVQENGRMTIMFNSFDKTPLILKLFGKAEVIHSKDEAWEEMMGYFKESVGIRQFFKMHVELVLTSCGFGVPKYEYIGERGLLQEWADKKQEEGIKAYWAKNNTLTLDGVATNILEKSK